MSIKEESVGVDAKVREKHRAFHDLGGREHQPFVISEHEPSDFDKDTEVVVNLLASKEVALVNPAERRRGIEELPEAIYFAVSYYERWLYGVTSILVEKDILSAEDLSRAMSVLDGKE